VEGATGNVDTNYDGKAQAAINAILGGADFVYLHIEAPDECGHRGEIENKIKAIELIDEKIVGPVFDALSKSGQDFKMLILPDHPTPLSTKTHSRDAVPFILYDSTNPASGADGTFTEQNARAAQIIFNEGYKLTEEFLR